MNRLNPKRTRILQERQYTGGAVAYWMSRDQRAEDNWALLFAQQRALELRVPLIVVFCLVPQFLGATIRQYGFMLKGLKELRGSLADYKVPFSLLRGNPEIEIPHFLKQNRIGLLITDFDPLRVKRQWKRDVGERIDIPFYEVDTHNIVPCWIASPKQEYAAYTFRPKILKALDTWLEPFPVLLPHPHQWRKAFPDINWDHLQRELQVDHSVGEVDWILPGEHAAHQALEYFIREKLAHYSKDRNDPTRNGQSGLSPYLHFGQISAQRVALDVERSSTEAEVKRAFLEELIVRRELSDNFCFYNQHYDTVCGFPEWARKTLEEHHGDPKQHSYTPQELESGVTHDDLWNAAQLEMVNRGKMHGYMRMYWAKKLLEWSGGPEEAMKIAIYLNDRWELDGRDPNGYTGIAWSIGGVHDRAWPEREIFGKIRYMSYNGCKSKFDVKLYMERNLKSTV